VFPRIHVDHIHVLFRSPRIHGIQMKSGVITEVKMTQVPVDSILWVAPCLHHRATGNWNNMLSQTFPYQIILFKSLCAYKVWPHRLCHRPLQFSAARVCLYSSSSCTPTTLMIRHEKVVDSPWSLLMLLNPSYIANIDYRLSLHHSSRYAAQQ
jgi:hypothetical protein